MPRHDRQQRHTANLRASIASVAARLIAEDGISDYQQAKLKAARQLGAPAHTPFPDNAEVDSELRAYQSLYLGDEHLELLQQMRETAIQLLEMFADFSPYLTGSVLEGTAGEHSTIDILLFPDSAKEVEIFLLNRDITFDHLEPRNEKVEAVFSLSTEAGDVKLIIMPPHLERMAFKGKDGRVRERAKIDAVRALIAEPSIT